YRQGAGLDRRRLRRAASRRHSLRVRGSSVRILLDTQVWLWVLGDPSRLSAAGRARLRSPANTFYLSAANVWEIAIKSAIGKLRLPDEPVAYLRGRLAETPATILPITHDHTLQLALLPFHHRDPFDRILVDQAQVKRLLLMTSDRWFEAYAVETVSA